MGSKDNSATKKIRLTKAKKNKSVNIKAKDLEASLKGNHGPQINLCVFDLNMIICNLKCIYNICLKLQNPKRAGKTRKFEASFLIIIWKFIDTADHKTKIRAPS